MLRRVILLLLGLLGSVLIGAALGLRSRGAYHFHGYVLPVPKREGDMFLRSADGPLRLSDYQGKLVLLYFGYTSCPDVCPTSLAKLKAAIEGLPAEQAAQLQVIFISVDPRRDTPARTTQYAQVFSPAFTGATGTQTEVDLVAQSFGVYYKINPPDASGNYSVDHSSFIYVIDRRGYLVLEWGHDVQPDEMRLDLEYLLKNGMPISAQLLAGPTYTPVVCSLTLIPSHVQNGQWLYEHHCAQCHGLDLKGNPAYQGTVLSDGSHLPPPLDSSGQIWRYSEADLIQLIKSGRNLDKAIHMTAFGNTLSDWEIHYILQYVASKWDVNQRNYQAGFFTLTPQPTFAPTPTPGP